MASFLLYSQEMILTMVAAQNVCVLCVAMNMKWSKCRLIYSNFYDNEMRCGVSKFLVLGIYGAICVGANRKFNNS